MKPEVITKATRICVAVALVVGFVHFHASAAGFSGLRIEDMDLDENPFVVTNVNFDGLATASDVTNIVDAISSNLTDIAALIPAQASPSNQLADKAFVNSSINGKQDKLPYPTNAIPQSSVSGLPAALADKVSESDFNTATNLFVKKSGDTVTGILCLKRGMVFDSNQTVLDIDTYFGTLRLDFPDGGIVHVSSPGSYLEGFSVIRIPNASFTPGNFATLDDNGFILVDSGKNSSDFVQVDDFNSATNALSAYTDLVISNSISASNTTFSNAVLSVGLNIGTNTVAAINALVEQGEQLPVGGTTTVGALLVAIVTAIVALRRKLNYPFVAAEFSSGVLTISPFANNQVDSTTLANISAVSSVAVRSANVQNVMRDLWLVVDCTQCTAEDLPNWNWGNSPDFVGMNGDNENLALEAGKECVFMLSEFTANRFMVARQVFDAQTA